MWKSSATLALAAALAAASSCATPPSPPANSGQPPVSSSAELADETRARECNDLVTIINRAAEEIDRLGDGGPELSIADLDSMARVLEQAATGAAALNPTVAVLKKHAADYSSMARGTAAAARALAEATRGEDPARIEAARKRLEEAVDPEEKIVQAINALCQAP